MQAAALQAGPWLLATYPEQTFGNGETMLVRSFIPDYLGGGESPNSTSPARSRSWRSVAQAIRQCLEATSVLHREDFVSFIVVSGSLRRLRSFLDRELRSCGSSLQVE